MNGFLFDKRKFEILFDAQNTVCCNVKLLLCSRVESTNLFLNGESRTYVKDMSFESRRVLLPRNIVVLRIPRETALRRHNISFAIFLQRSTW